MTTEPEVSRDDQLQTARNVVLRQLSAAQKTRHQLAEKLRQRELPDDVIDEVLDRFSEVELIDDASFAESWVRSRHQSRGLSRRMLQRELQQRGVCAEDIEQALAQLSDEDERTAADALIQQKLARTTIPESTDAESRKQRDRMVRRLVGMLARKGYSPGMAFSVVTDAMQADDLDPIDE